ncbi:hypothetical protein [Rathayibacter sp. VKM Ac-2760]|uniref:hypothetical protein n=1 Tax=Rathayibacter sp. VKM Ac-2760 TaxID=2609253 RepID=UPI001315D534|nr:hypothetical protein [Rathayibacter sp. VKM Ac-2760]QHC60154.1 hypothetical protein GSU72_17535 [Rathayibacter sp. VKM Ac-2760]
MRRRGSSAAAVAVASLLLGGCVGAESGPAAVGAGGVADGTVARVSAAGTVDVSYQRQGDFAVVVALDCSACSGTVTVSAPGRSTPVGEAAAGTQSSWLLETVATDPVDQSLLVQAVGNWTLTLQSWNDLPEVSGEQSGSGSAVLAFSDRADSLDVAYGPASSEDSLSGRVLGTAGTRQTFGDTTSFARVVDAALPGVVALRTDGSWTLTPVP